MWQRIVRILYCDVIVLFVLLSLSIAFKEAVKVPMLNALICRNWRPRDAHPTAIDASSERFCERPEILQATAHLAGSDTQCLSLTGLLISIPTAWIASHTHKYRLLAVTTFSFALKSTAFYLVCCYYIGDVRLVLLTNAFDFVGASENFMYSKLLSLLAEKLPADLRSSTFLASSAIALALRCIVFFLSGVLLRQGPWTVGLLTVFSSLCLFGAASVLLLRGESEPGMEDPVDQRQKHVRSSSESSGVTEHSSLLGQSGSDHGNSQEHPSHQRQRDRPTSLVTFGILLYQNFLSSPLFLAGFSIDGLVTLGKAYTIILQEWASVQFHWSLANTTFISSYSMFVCLVVLIISPFFNARIISQFPNTRMMDLFLVRLYLGLFACGALLLAFSDTVWRFFPSLTVAKFGIGVSDCADSLFIGHANPTYITELLVLKGMVNRLAGILAGRLWPFLFQMQLQSPAFLPGWPFAASFFVFGLALAITFIFHARICGMREEACPEGVRCNITRSSDI